MGGTAMTIDTSARPAFTPCLNPATVTGLGLEEFARLAAKASFTSIEVSIQQVLAYGPRRTADLLDGLGITVAAASGILPDGPVLPHPLLIANTAYATALAGLPERLAAFTSIGCPVATTVLNPRTRWDPDVAMATAAGRIRGLAKACADHGVTLAVEAVGVRAGLPAYLDGPHDVASTLPQLHQVLERAGHGQPPAGVSACVDSFHWAATGADPAHLTGLAPLRVGHVQIADTPPGTPARQWSDEMRLFPGDGSLPWEVFVRALAAAGYNGPVSVELFNPALRLLPETQIAQRAYAAALTAGATP